MFYIRSSDLIHLMTESLFSSTNLCLFPHLTAPGNHFLTLYETVFKTGQLDFPQPAPFSLGGASVGSV